MTQRKTKLKYNTASRWIILIY